MLTTRTPEVDIIRLVALLGICIANIPTMGISDGLSVNSLFEIAAEPIDQYAKFFTGLLIDGKFVLLFSFIFGWGIAVQEKRITQAGGDFKSYFFKRSFGLILLGVIHMALVFGGDILLTYGVVSLCFWYFKDYVLQTALKDFIWRMIRLQYLVIILIGLAMAISLFAMDLEDSDFFSVSNDALSGSFMEASYYRLIDGAPYLVLSTISFIPQALAVFGLGYLAEHAGFFRENSESFQKLKALLPKLLIGGLVCNVVYAVGISEISDNGLWLGVGILLWLVGAPALSAVYLYYLIIIARRIQLPEIFILAGRNSLSVYVLQGIIASLMFGGYGLGWFGEFGELALIPVGIGIYFVTVVIVGLYAKRFGRGFLEPILRGISG
jgi:uncharacterized protein